MPNSKLRPFLKAEWRKLAMASYVVDESVLTPFLPPKTELDYWGPDKRCYITLVGFMFVNTRVKGIRIPGHVNFEEVNLRFYVRYLQNGEWKRGVVFIQEIVSRPAVTMIANALYNENYKTMPTAFEWIASAGVLNVEYRWKSKSWNVFRVSTEKAPTPVEPGSEEEFITEHYWAYTKAGANRVLEYEVEHPRWDIYPMRSFRIDVDFADVYGESFGFLSSQKPTSVILAEGSEVIVRDSKKI